MRVDIATDYYTQNMDKAKREIWGLALAVTVSGFFLPGAAILRSHKLLHQRETEVGNNRQFLPGETVFGVISRHLANRLSSLLQNDCASRTAAKNDWKCGGAKRLTPGKLRIPAPFFLVSATLISCSGIQVANFAFHGKISTSRFIL